MTGVDRPGAELFAELLALTQIAQEGLGQKSLGRSVAGPLELVVAPRHVLDQVFHPEQCVTPISHRQTLLHSPRLDGRKNLFPSRASDRSPEAISGCVASHGLGRSPRAS
jgi:hypothetical protein